MHADTHTHTGQIEKHHVVLAIDEANMLFYDTQYVMDFKPVRASERASERPSVRAQKSR